MEPFPYYYSRRNRSSKESIDSNMRLMLDELQCMEERLSDKIDGRCGGLEQCLVDSEQRLVNSERCNEERFISLEMAHSESETSRADVNKRFEGLKLEVHRINRLLEHENFENPQGKLRFFGSREPTQPVGAVVANPKGDHADTCHQGFELGTTSNRPQMRSGGMSLAQSHFHDVDLPHDSQRSH
jgi:hypothetical protein